MLRFFAKLGILLVPFLIFLAWAEYKLSSMPNSYSKKLTLLEKNSTSIEVLVLGSSHTAHAINPAFWHYHGFVMAHRAQSVYQDTQILLCSGIRLPKLKLVIFPASYFSLELNPEGLVNLNIFYSRHYHIPLPMRHLRPSLQNFCMVAKYGIHSSIVRLFEGFPADDFSDPSTVADNGWIPRDRHLSTDPTINDRYAVEQVQYHESSMENKYINLNTSYWQQALTWCKSNNVKAVFITTPVHKFYTDHLDKKRFNLMQVSVRKLAPNTAQNILILVQMPGLLKMIFVTSAILILKGRVNSARL